MSEIVERGEPPAGLDFEQLYRDDFVRAVRLAHLLTGSNDAAEDIAQEAFLRVRTVRSEIRDPQAYLTTTVVRLCRNWQRGRRSRATTCCRCFRARDQRRRS